MDNAGRRDGSIHSPAGSNPGVGLNNLFVMNINSRKLIRIAVRLASHDSRFERDARERGRES